MTTKAHDIDAIEARRDELAGDYVGIFRAFNGTMNDIPARSDLRDLDARREAAARDTRAALEDQERIAQALIENAHAALGWADGVLDSGDFSDGLDGMDRESLARVFDRAVVRGDKARAVAAARRLDADGDTTAIPRLDANYSDVGVALDYLEAYGGDPSAVLAPLRPYGVKLPDDSRIRPSAEVARQIEREEAALHDAKAAKRGADRRELHDRISATLSGGRAIGDEARQRVRRAPFGYGG